MKKKSYVFHRRLDYDYPVITYGDGIYLYDETGKRYIDAVGGAMVAVIGHGVKDIAEKMGRLAEKVSYLHGAQFTTGKMEDYARRLCGVAPSGLNRVYFVSGGSEATETAIKMARQYHYDSGDKKRYKVIYTWPSYHGSTLASLSLTGKANIRKIHSPLLLDFPHIPSCFCYRCPYHGTYPGCGLECARALEKVIRSEGEGSVSAFIVEPVIGTSAGAVVPPPEYLPIVQKICNKYKILLVLDEILCGFGRTGKWFACQHWNVHPDIIMAGKGISAGFVPLAAVFCTEKIVGAIRDGSGSFLHGYTYGNNSFTTGVGGIVLDYIIRHNLIENCRKRGKYLISRLKELEEYEIVGDVRGLGLLAAVEFVRDKKTRRPFPRNRHLAEKIVQRALSKGLNLYFSIGFADNLNGDAVIVAPPYNVTEGEIDRIVDIFFETIREIQVLL